MTTAARRKWLGEWVDESERMGEGEGRRGRLLRDYYAVDDNDDHDHDDDHDKWLLLMMTMMMMSK